MIMEQLQEIFRDVFADDAIVLQGTTTSSDIEDWDSLAHIQLILRLKITLGFSLLYRKQSLLLMSVNLCRLLKVNCKGFML